MKDFEEIRQILRGIAVSRKEDENSLKNTKKILDDLALSRKESETKNEKENKRLRDFLDNLSIKQDNLTIQVDRISKSFEGFTKNQGSMFENLFFESLRDDMILDNVVYDDILLNLEIKKRRGFKSRI